VLVLNKSTSEGEEIRNEEGQFRDPRSKSPEDAPQAVVAVRRLVRREIVMRKNDVVNPHIHYFDKIVYYFYVRLLFIKLYF